MYVLVAAVASSGPAATSIECSAARARGEPGAFVMAMVGAPCARAASMTATTSGDRPDWLMPMTSARSRRGAIPYSDTSDGVASATGSRWRAPNRYWA